MMGEGMPAAVAKPASGPAAAPTASTAAAPPANAGAGAAATREPGQPDTAPGPFDLLLANLPASATTSTSVSTSTPRQSPDEQDAATPATGAGDAGTTDPLLLVLAQVLPQASPATASVPAAGTSPAADAATAATTGAAMTTSPARPSPTQSTAPQSAMDAALSFANAAAGAATDANASPTAADATPADAASPVFESQRPTTAPVDASPQPLQALAATHTHTPAVHAPFSASAAPLSQPADPSAGYDDSFGTQVTWLAEQRIGEAQIRVSPEHLGAIDIRLQLDGKDVRAEFHSAQPEVRQALEASLPRLRDMLGQHGLQLAHAGVGQGQKQRDGTPFATTSGTTSHVEGDTVPPPGFRRMRGLVDVYA